MKTNKGFTLLELMIVIAIIGILAAVMVPQYAKYNKRIAEKATAEKIEECVKQKDLSEEECRKSVSSS